MPTVTPIFYKMFRNIPFSAGVMEQAQLEHSNVKHPVGIVAGVRTMGSVIAESIVAAGYQTILGDIDPEICVGAKDKISTALTQAVRRGTFSKELHATVKRDELVGPLIALTKPFSSDINEAEIKQYLMSLLDPDIVELLKHGTFFVEAGPEKVSVKEMIHAIYSAILQSNGNPNNAIVTSNTSGKTLKEIGQYVIDKEKFALFHFLFPGRVNNVVVELGFGEETSPVTILRLQNLARKMGIKPVICFRDSPGAIGNRFLTGLLNEEARMYDEGLGSPEYTDQVLHEILYGDLKLLKTGRALRDFEHAPGLRAILDEDDLYLKINKLDRIIKYAPTKKILQQKYAYLIELQRKLNQKVLYAGIIEDFQRIGTFYTTAKFVKAMKEHAQSHLNDLNAYMKKVNESKNNLYNPLNMTPYKTAESASGQLVKNDRNRELIRDRLLGTYLAIAQSLYNEGLATKHDIQTICTDGYKWIISPFDLANKLGAQRVNYLLRLVDYSLLPNEVTGICKPSDNTSINPMPSTKEEICGVQTYVQKNIGFIDLSRTSIQHLDIMQNLLNPDMLEGIIQAIDQLENDSNVEAIFIRSQGGNVFSAGIDLDYLDGKVGWDQDKYKEYMKLTNIAMDRIEACKIPTTAIIDGAVVSSGIGLALACDHRIMTDTAFVQFTDVAVGNIPASGILKRLPALIGKTLAKRLVCRPKLLKILPDTPRQYTKAFFGSQRLYGRSAAQVGFADACITQDRTDVFMADLIGNHVTGINIYEKSKTSEKKNHNKSDYPLMLGDGLGIPFWLNFRWLTRKVVDISKQAISVSHVPEEVERMVDSNEAIKESISASKNVTKQYINRLKLAATGNWKALSGFPFSRE